MATVALIDANGVVRDKQKIDNSQLADDGAFTPACEASAQEYQSSLGLTPEGCEWRLCSFSGAFRGAYPGLGWLWDGENFIAPASTPAV